MDRVVDRGQELARAVLLTSSPDAMVALADAVLDTEHVRLALEVRAGGPHAARRAIELAVLVLSEASPALAAARGETPP
ncbi:hypothetical protein [Sandaracinus amylolyticus]|uniref:hypothetical protein n=1 Tax=Sandaracinus amylolyticus TaxID=927083 RepID=UPI001F313802|nr:hypothetical protein [Sandaracinus amylolyticus]